MDLSKKQNKIVGVTYGYAGYQMIQQARQMIADGLLGEIRIVNMQFAHGFHNQAVELQAESTRWRVTPKFAGPSYVLGIWPPIRCLSPRPWRRSSISNG
ncbi:Oxidoreductase [Klebsiella pneumoniae]|uniref:Oxidoreductase n=1 Tax=Klebsiella pneumoniae TaxID=573 RepID=A0A377W5W6_KLEPN|nr:Oxidoreductase [Klebsiella pneumoniae]